MGSTIIEHVSGKIDLTVSGFRDKIASGLDETKAARIKADKKFAQSFLHERMDSMLIPKTDLDFILPEGIRFFCGKTKYAGKLFVIEQEPMTRTLSFSESFFGNDKYHYHLYYDRKNSHKSYKDYPPLKRFNVQLAFPYVIFFVEIFSDGSMNLHVYYSKKPLSFMNDQLYKVNLPNLYYGYSVCTYFPGFRKEHDTLGKKVAYVIEDFWGSQFRTDASYNYFEMQQKDKRFANVWEWGEKSLADPSFVLNVDWKCMHTLNEAIRMFLPGSAKQSFKPDPCLSAFAIQYFKHTGSLIGESCPSVEISKVGLSKPVVEGFVADIKEEIKRFGGLVFGARVLIRKDSEFYHQAKGIPGVVTRDFNKSWAGELFGRVTFDNGSENGYRRKDLKLFKE